MRPLPAALVFWLASAAAYSQEATTLGDWPEKLRRQMLGQENCRVSFIGEVVERPSPYQIRAKVTCEDQRVFTVQQDMGPEQPFKVVGCSREGPSC